MQSQTQSHRTPRIPGPPACDPCRRRKSRCKFDGLAQECLMCRTHQTECVMSAQRSSARDHRRRRAALPGSTRTTTPETSTLASGATTLVPHAAVVSAAPGSVIGNARTSPINIPQAAVNAPGYDVEVQPGSAVSLEATEEENPHIVGPATAGDSHFLEDYLSNIQQGHNRAIRPVLPGVTTEPVVFMRVKKRPLGIESQPDPSPAKLQIILKLLEPWQDRLLNLYFSLGNGCFPPLDEESFRTHNAHSRISPAVVACLYAHAMCYWNYDPHLRQQHRPDGRFIWNLALDILYSELHVSPGMSTIIAILLNIGGRPTTTMVGNGTLLGSAISLAQSLGLNWDPQTWNIREREKTLRIHIWWCLIIHDRWTSLTYGTPPHIRQAFYDVPLPRPLRTDSRDETFSTLASLTTVLGSYIEQLYSKGDQMPVGEAVANLDAWTDTLLGEQRRIIVRGTNLDMPGAANLRMCYLAARFFMCRAELGAEMEHIVPGQPLPDRLLRIRRMVEDIVLFVHELTEKQLGDFWLPTMSFVFSSTVAFLLRLAVQAELPAVQTPQQSLSLSLAQDLVKALRMLKDLYGWELGDICLSQYGDVVDKLWEQNGAQGVAMDVEPVWLQDAPFILDPGFYEPIDINEWDPLT